MFGLSYAVAAITAKTEVSNDGLLLVKGGDAVVATDSTASTYVIDKIDVGYCLSRSETLAIQALVMEGRNVLVEYNGQDGIHTMQQISASGSTYDESTGEICYTLPESGKQMCVVPDEGCNDEMRRRRLQDGETGLDVDFGFYFWPEP